MKKTIKLTEGDLVNLVKKVIKEQNPQYGSFGDNPYNPLQIKLAKNSGYETNATVEDDMYMTFLVLGFILKGNKIGMVIKEKEQGLYPQKLMIVYNFGGPILDYNTKKQIFTDSSFGSIDENNFMKIAKQNNIPINK